ncbi:low affinity immunoglobulin gamma Fc region receptor II-like [Sphaeramia orbicularis]|uniref:low affinity immunoglobulin gamma Fc region receptor II-like n=1 Tax=Sphaeramia orbicularis TaxID=375764 RepID=UPI00117F6DCB|nr:low affinity immunoglobulin gamma Fc region receptor II-like [Sphaeramia orbicularis]
MGVAALCFRLLISVIVLQRAHGQEGNAVLQVVPNKLQFFEYDTVSFLCKGLDSSSEWKVVHNSRRKSLQCSNTRTPTTLTCTFKGIYKEESGEYWCEAGAKKRTNSVVITVTPGSVILESPALPVSEGKEVTLRCRNKMTSSSIFMTYFYKDGVLMHNSTTGNLIIHNVFKSDEGRYKCRISAAGESAENWLNVTAGSVILESPALPVSEGKEVTLRCRNKTTSSSIFTTYFYKDGVLMHNSTTGNLIIHNVFKSDEGRYKCRISAAGESAENWLNVTASGFKLGGPITHLSCGDAVPWIVSTILLTVLLCFSTCRHLHLDQTQQKKQQVVCGTSSI